MFKKLKDLSIENIKGHNGFSLVAVMVGVGVSLMLAVLIGQTIVNTKAVQKKMESMQGYRELDQKLINIIGTQFLQKISLSPNCIDYSALFSADSIFIQHATNYKFNSTNEKLSSSLIRCQNPIRPNSYYAPGAFFDFCIRPLKDIAGVGSSGSNTVVAEKMAEVQIRLYDIHSMKPLSCSEYMNKRNNSLDKTASAFLWIRLFWEAKADGQLKIFSRDLNFIFGSI